MPKNSVKGIAQYRKFLGSIPLTKYREELKDIKWVEQDLVPALYPLASIYKNYWDSRNFLMHSQKLPVLLAQGYLINILSN